MKLKYFIMKHLLGAQSGATYFLILDLCSLKGGPQ